ncbi:SDR family NAD(P)-dependent oxidoreductase [Streptomyces asiaticus]|uniref:SDR family NAD(P)-dependent oxidoreductase n=1 Tax=Streptomyces asiaticus TaxID=114695 RepID=UPI003D7329B3
MDVERHRLGTRGQRTVQHLVEELLLVAEVLVDNAGVMALPELTRTPDGRETQFAVNHLGHFALAVGLHQALAAAEGARLVSVSSLGHLFSPVVFDDLDYRFRPYDPWTSYGQSKTANILFAVGAAERWADDGITANALMPGNIGDTSLARHVDPQQLAGFIETTGLALPPQKNVAQGATTSVLLAASPTVEGITGRYFGLGAGFMSVGAIPGLFATSSRPRSTPCPRRARASCGLSSGPSTPRSRRGPGPFVWTLRTVGGGGGCPR